MQKTANFIGLVKAAAGWTGVLSDLVNGKPMTAGQYAKANTGTKPAPKGTADFYSVDQDEVKGSAGQRELDLLNQAAWHDGEQRVAQQNKEREAAASTPKPNYNPSSPKMDMMVARAEQQSGVSRPAMTDTSVDDAQQRRYKPTYRLVSEYMTPEEYAQDRAANTPDLESRRAIAANDYPAVPDNTAVAAAPSHRELPAFDVDKGLVAPPAVGAPADTRMAGVAAPSLPAFEVDKGLVAPPASQPAQQPVQAPQVAQQPAQPRALGMDAWKKQQAERLHSLGYGQDQIDTMLTNEAYRKSNGGRNDVDTTGYRTLAQLEAAGIRGRNGRRYRNTRMARR